uniref:Uncharacterized protein n=1 Tax=Acrobeloides nanus TaxID=290746 RepID=A0A914E2L1_9BILA
MEASKASNVDRKLKRAKVMKRHFTANRHRSIVFTNEKLFTIEERLQKPKSWFGPLSLSTTKLIWFSLSKVSKSIKSIEKCFENICCHGRGSLWRSFMDSSTRLYIKTSSTGHIEIFPRRRRLWKWILRDGFHPSKECTAHIPELNAMDYSVWSILETSACSKPHKTVESLKRSLTKIWDEEIRWSG